MIIEQEIEIITDYEASCNGQNKTGHPLIYFHLEENEEVACPYCSKIFKQQS